MMLTRSILSIVMLLHGVAHLPGLVTAWRLRPLPDFPYHTVLLRGRVDVGDAGMRVVGTLWLAAAVGFGVAATGAFLGDPRWIPVAVVTALLSSVLCVLEWPLARVGLWVNLVILSALVLTAGFLAP
jgi:hypothetical protein